MNKLIHIEKCPSCNSKNIIAFMDTKDYFFTQENFKITKCEDCELVFTNPIPKYLGEYYETTDYLSHNTNDNGALGKLYSFLRSININRKYKLVTKYNTVGKILDIGCGTGELISHFQNNNWQVTGVEPNKTAREYATQKYNLSIFEEERLENLVPNSFDVISMWHVLEHVQNLHERLSQISKLLKTTGTVFIALPNINSPDSQKYKELWSALDVPRHLYHFTETTFAKLISNHNMKIVHAEPMKLDAYYVSMLSEKYRKNKLYLPTALITGFIANLKAKKKNNYSSMIYVVKKF